MNCRKVSTQFIRITNDSDEQDIIIDQIGEVDEVRINIYSTKIVFNESANTELLELHSDLFGNWRRIGLVATTSLAGSNSSYYHTYDRPTILDGQKRIRLRLNTDAAPTGLNIGAIYVQIIGLRKE